MKIIITIEVEEDKVVNVSTETKESEEEVTDEKRLSSEPISDYARVFNEVCTGWTEDAEYNLMYLKHQQTCCNTMVRVNGHLFLNDVYQMLGLPRTKAGQIVGWIYDEESPISDNFVDFGLYDERNYDFINGHTNVALLDFNVDGNILDRI